MKKLKIFIKYFSISLFFLYFATLSVFPEQQEIPKDVMAMVGNYAGSWSMYGIDSKGNIVEKMKWTDTMEAMNPVIRDGRAFVETLDKMKFEGSIPPQQVKGTEGYFLNKNWSLGDYYFETFGQVFKMFQIDKHTWVYSTPANPGRLAFLGFSNVISGRHVVVKEITDEAGTEVHRISRVTTINWKDKDGKIRWKQFVSLKGFHKRLKTAD